MSGNNLSVEKVVRKIDKDKFSATSYCIYYILEFTNKDDEEKHTDFSHAPSCVSNIDF